MDIKSLTLKNILIDDNNDEYFDLSVPSFDIGGISMKDVHAVTQDEEGRIDKVCNKYFGSSENIDVLCFINHIFNPFSIEQNDLLVIPQIGSISGQIYKKPDIPTWLEGGNSTGGSPNPKTNEKDENRINRINQKRKPNDLPEGVSAKKYINGKIILGTHLNTNNG